ncbi:Hypothetical predicted protein [Lecanosticta acicola]|uniref:Uncharacterized protein n=1 Tax=Lecanosticta acicola TaxID=111012 RepID=A0AAI8Z5V5_9PEZI|nr:Hypothetical predicted protein [Lecanosticta acicola]
MDDSPLSRLSGELRNKIYEYALYEPAGIPVHVSPPASKERRTSYEVLLNRINKPAQPHKSPLCGLPQTCRALRQETLKLCFSLNKVVVYTKLLDKQTYYVNYTNYCMHQLSKWAALVGGEQRDEVKEIVIHCGTATESVAEVEEIPCEPISISTFERMLVFDRRWDACYQFLEIKKKMAAFWDWRSLLAMLRSLFHNYDNIKVQVRLSVLLWNSWMHVGIKRGEIELPAEQSLGRMKFVEAGLVKLAPQHSRIYDLMHRPILTLLAGLPSEVEIRD